MKSILNENNLIFERYVEGLDGGNDSTARIQRLIDEGVDIFFNDYTADACAVVFNSGSRTGDYSNVVTESAYNAIEEYIADNEEVFFPEGFPDDMQSKAEFFSPKWNPLTNIEQLDSCSGLPVATDHNGSDVWLVEI